MPLICLNENTFEERSLQTKAYDLKSFSVALDMHDSFIKQIKEIFPLLQKLIGETEFEERFNNLMYEYEHIGRPNTIYNEDSHKYLEKVKKLGKDILQCVEDNYPLEIEFIL